MNKMLKLAAISALVATSFITIAEEKPEVKFSTTEVSPGLFMLKGEGGFTGGNLGLSVGDDGVILIDDSMPNFLGLMQAAIADVTKKPIDFVINTHVHGDHTGNNKAMGNGGSHIVAHENLRDQLVKKGVRGKDGMIPAPKASLPVITFSKTMSFHFNGNPATLIHVPSAHTDGDALVHFESINVIHAGDTLFNGMFPFIDLNSGGSVDGYIAAQQKIISMSDDKTKIIAGHGPLASKSDVEASLAMLKDCKKIIAKFVAKGIDEDDVVKQNPLAKYNDKWNWQFITTEKMTRQIYKGLSQAGKQAHNHNETLHSHGH